MIHVTGARGLLGVQVMRAVAPLGPVQGTDVDSMDVTRMDSILSVLRADMPEVLVHLAALKGNVPSQQQPLDFFSVNTMGTLNLLEACRQLGIKRFIFVSSMTVHGPTDVPIDERAPWAPLHPYAGSKAAAEAMVQAYVNAYGLQAVIFRPNFIVGSIPSPLPYADNLVYSFLQALQATGVIELAGDGSYQREWLHPRDIASAIALAIRTPLRGHEAFVLSGNRVTMRELAERVIRLAGRGRVTTDPARSGFSLISSSEKAKRLLGWEPQMTLDDILAEIVAEYESRLGTPDHCHHGN